MGILAAGCLIRLWRLGGTPSGMHQVEAHAAYEAFCLLRDGHDSWGYAWPVYFVSWGSGIFFVCFGVGCLTDGDIIRINTLMLPAAAVIAHGVRLFLDLLPAGRVLLAGAYASLFLFFAGDYFTGYAKALKTPFQDGLAQALSRAEELAGEGVIHVSGDIEYPRILFYDHTDPDAFRETFRYEGAGSAFLTPVSFTRFAYDLEQAPDSGVLLLSPYDSPADYPGYSFETFGVVTVAHKP